MSRVARAVDARFAFRIAPATLGYLLRDCERCFIREVRDRIRRPGGPPPIFAFADAAMKRAFDVPEGCWVDVGVPAAPRFRPIAQGFAVISAPLHFPELDVSLTLAGNLDAFVETDDGRRMLIDYKTSPGELTAARYAGQLDGYAFALEHPAPQARYEPTSVDAMALLVFRPRTFVAKRSGLSGLYGPTGWVEVPQNGDRLMRTLRHVAALLIGIEAPAGNDVCMFCQYHAVRAPY